jgi:hypothetical protein|tara:strand:+ start:708 stop:1175 length:468 start_codon:yes stop_codon:yes gene_type:complete
MYTLYSDKQNIFECDIQLEGASLTEAFARLIIESKNVNLLYEGTITSDGNCRIDMPKLKGIIKEGGNLRLEVIADDMYFNPWESQYDLKAAKTVTVEVREQKKAPLVESKPKLKVNILGEKPRKSKSPVVESKETENRKKVLTKKEIHNLLSRLR